MSTQLQTLRSALENKISSIELSGFFSDAVKDEFINEAGKRVCNFESWTWLRHAYDRDSEANQEWYQDPTDFKPESIYRLTLEDENGKENQHDIIEWNHYNDHKENGTGVKVAALLGGQYFLYPVPTVEGRHIGVFGEKKWIQLTDDADTAISPASFDESIVRLAFASCLKKESRFSEAGAEVDEVENIILPRLFSQQNKRSPKGYIGQQKSTRW